MARKDEASGEVGNGAAEIHAKDRKQSRTADDVEMNCESARDTAVVKGLKVDEEDLPPVSDKEDNMLPVSINSEPSEETEQKQPLKEQQENNSTEKIVAPKAEFETIDLDEGENKKGEYSGVQKGENFKPNPQSEEDEITCDGPQMATMTVKDKDEVDAASVYSLFMEKDFRYYFQHPYFRLFLAYFVTFCNFLIYAEDPVAHSIKECSIPVIGNDFAFICTRYPRNAWSLLKVFLWLSAIVIGAIVGKLLFHTLLFNKVMRLKMFHDDQGSWMTMFFTVILCVFIISHIYNVFLLIGGDSTEPFWISDLTGISNSWFMKAAACGTWCGDFFTAWMVTDMMLQEKLYPNWAKRVRAWWVSGYNRIILFWIITSVTSFVVIFVIATDYISWDKLNRDLLPSNELSRSFLASFILVMDMMIVMQDWDFPNFISAIDIKLPGINTAHIHFSIPKCLKREAWHFHITGKWFNYGVLFIVIILDLNMWKNQIFFSPFDFGQYAGPEDRIHTILDTYSFDTFNSSQLTFTFRNVTINPVTNKTYISGDGVMNTRFYNYALGVKCLAFIPCLATFLLFGFLIWRYGRYKPTREDPYAGRLKKRKKGWRGFSARIQWRKLRNRIRTAEPILMYFRRRGHNVENTQEKRTESYPENWNP